MIIALLGIHIYETSKEVYLHKRLDSMHYEYVLALNIKHAVSRQVKEAMSGVVFGFSKPQAEKYNKTKKDTDATLNDLINSISTELDYIADHEIENEEGEGRKARYLLSQYAEIDKRLTIVNQLVSEGSDRKRVQKILADVDKQYESFVSLTNQWIAQEQEELQNVNNTLSSMTNRNTIILIAGAVLTIIFAMTMSLSIILLIIDPRMKELIDGTQRIARGDLNTPIELGGNDEFTTLYKAFNLMMSQLQISQKNLLEQSYYSGMAEMVSGILHNIKNSFAPFIVDTEIIYHHIKNIKMKQFQPILAELRDDTLDPERKKNLIDLSALLFDNSNEALAQVRDKLAGMQNRATLIERIIEEQSALANSQRLIEEVSLLELLHDSLSLIKKEFLDNVKVSIAENVQTVGHIKTQRIILLQVFKNIIVNAIESTLRSNNNSGEVLVQAAIANDDEQIHITISDHGEGIKQELLPEIFKRGVSGKSKQSGLGLHWCANSVSALKGRIYAESEGLGKGASFHLFLNRS
jgi:signal transduction histidine kinase